jgi:hypothetical protein
VLWEFFYEEIMKPPEFKDILKEDKDNRVELASSVEHMSVQRT